jgi:hypothetical protein
MKYLLPLCLLVLGIAISTNAAIPTWVHELQTSPRVGEAVTHRTLLFKDETIELMPRKDRTVNHIKLAMLTGSSTETHIYQAMFTGRDDLQNNGAWLIKPDRQIAPESDVEYLITRPMHSEIVVQELSVASWT